MVKAVLFIASFLDLCLAALLFGLSKSFFEDSPGVLLTAVWSAIFIFSIAATIMGKSLIERGRTATGLVVAWLPPPVAIAAAWLGHVLRDTAALLR